MTHDSTDVVLSDLEAEESASVIRAAPVSALSILLIGLQASPATAGVLPSLYSPMGEDRTQASAVIKHSVDDIALLHAFSDVYDQLLTESHDLDPIDRELIYENLWELYE